MKNKWFDILKWIALICLPALQIAIPALFDIWNIPFGVEIGKTINVVAVLLGTLLGVSNVKYYQDKALLIAQAVDETEELKTEEEIEDPYKAGE